MILHAEIVILLCTDLYVTHEEMLELDLRTLFAIEIFLAG